MVVCRTLAEIEAAAAADAAKMPPISQEAADKIAMILAPHICRECGVVALHAPGCKAAS